MIPTKEDRDFASLTILSGGLHRSPFPFLPSSLSVLVFSRPPHIALGKGRQIQTSKAVAVCVCVCLSASVEAESLEAFSTQPPPSPANER